MSKTMKIIIGIVFVLLVFYLIGSQTPDTKYETIKTPVYSKDEFKQAYMEGCMEEGTYEYCSCTYDYILDKHGLDKFLDISVEYMKTEELPDEMWEAVKHCL